MKRQFMWINHPQVKFYTSTINLQISQFIITKSSETFWNNLFPNKKIRSALKKNRTKLMSTAKGPDRLPICWPNCRWNRSVSQPPRTASYPWHQVGWFFSKYLDEHVTWIYMNNEFTQLGCISFQETATPTPRIGERSCRGTMSCTGPARRS